MSSSLTVLIPNFNHGHLIGRQLASVFAQTLQPERVIIFDDASTDNSAEVIEKLVASRSSVEFVRKTKNSGPILLFNEGLRMTTTDYVVALAADDETLPTFFEKSVNQLKRCPEAAFCSAVSFVRHASGDFLWPELHPSNEPCFLPPREVLRLFLKLESWIICNSAIYRRSAVIEAGGFDPKLRNYSDGFLSRALALRHGACFIPEVLTVFYLDDAGFSMSDALSEERSAEILAYSNKVMRSDFAGLFPEKLIARNNARMLYRLLVLKLNNLKRSTRAAVGSASPTAGGSLVTSVVAITANILRFLAFMVLRSHDLRQRVLLRFTRRRPVRPVVGS